MIYVSEPTHSLPVKLYWIIQGSVKKPIQHGLSRQQIEGDLGEKGVKILRLKLRKDNRSFKYLMGVRDKALYMARKRLAKNGQQSGIVVFLWSDERFATYAAFPYELALKVLALGYYETEIECHEVQDN